jgi:hypothetical protein
MEPKYWITKDCTGYRLWIGHMPEKIGARYQGRNGFGELQEHELPSSIRRHLTGLEIKSTILPITIGLAGE